MSVRFNTNVFSTYGAGALFCLIATVSWGAAFPVMTSALRVIDPFTFTAMRYGWAGPIFVVFLVMREGWTALSLFPKWSPYRYTILTTVFGMTSILLFSSFLILIHGDNQ